MEMVSKVSCTGNLNSSKSLWNDYANMFALGSHIGNEKEWKRENLLVLVTSFTWNVERCTVWRYIKNFFAISKVGE